MATTSTKTAADDTRTGLRALRGVQSNGRSLRVFFAFDPRRAAILLTAGDKTGNPRFYKEMLPSADKLYTEHLRQLERGER